MTSARAEFTSRMSRAQICPLLLSVSLSFAGCASYSGIQGEAQALAPQSLAFYQDRTGGDWPKELAKIQKWLQRDDRRVAATG